MLTGSQLDLGAIRVNDDDRDRTVDLCVRVGYADFDVPVWGWYGASCFSQRPKPGCYSYAPVSGFGGRNAEDVPDEVTSGRAAPPVDRRTPTPTLTEGVIAIHQKPLPAPD